VDPDISFNKDDLLKQVDNKTRFLDYLWTLEEFDLLEKDNKNDYILKSADVLLKFKEKYGEVINESEDETIVETISKEKTSKKSLKNVRLVIKIYQFLSSINLEMDIQINVKNVLENLMQQKQ